MKQLQNIEKLNTLSYFDVNTISQITNIQNSNLYMNINRWVKQGVLIQLKNGLYTTKEYYSSISNQSEYLQFISNKLRYPSYLSLEYVLSKNQVLTETVYTYTSITKKTTRTYNNDLGSFSYRKISEPLFIGFSIVSKNGFEIAIANKTKALFDFLYLKLYREQTLTNQIINDLRLNLDEYSTEEIKEFQSYCNLTSIQKFKDLPKILFKKNDN